MPALIHFLIGCLHIVDAGLHHILGAAPVVILALIGLLYIVLAIAEWLHGRHK